MLFGNTWHYGVVDRIEADGISNDAISDWIFAVIPDFRCIGESCWKWFDDLWCDYLWSTATWVICIDLWSVIRWSVTMIHVDLWSLCDLYRLKTDPRTLVTIYWCLIFLEDHLQTLTWWASSTQSAPRVKHTVCWFVIDDLWVVLFSIVNLSGDCCWL